MIASSKIAHPKWLALYAIILIAIFSPASRAQTYQPGPWESLGDNVSIRFTQVNATMMTWEFRNDDPATTITFTQFTYTDSTGTHTDYLPGTLKPKQAIGGWAAFSATITPSDLTVTVKITTINRK